MKTQPVLYPDRVAIAKLSDITTFAQTTGTVTSPTIHSITSFFAQAYTALKLGTEGVVLNRNRTAIKIQEITAGGLRNVDVFEQGQEVQIVMTANAFTMAVESLRAGKNTDDVKDDATLVLAGAGYTYDDGDYIAPAADVTDAIGVAKGDTIEREALSILISCPVRGGTLYILAPKVKVLPDNESSQIVVDQIKPAVTFEALALDDDEVAPFVSLYSEVTRNGLVYKFLVPDQD